MDCRKPAEDDVVVEAYGLVRARRHAVRVTSGPPQLTCRSLAEATRIAVAFASHAHVDVWVREGTSAAAMVACFRDRPTEPADVGVVVRARAVHARRVRLPDR